MFNKGKYKQQMQSDLIQKWISNSLQYKRTFSVALNRYLFRPLSSLYCKTTKSRLTAAKASLSTAILEKSLTVLDCACVSCLFSVWVRRVNVVCSCIYIWVARVNPALRLFTRRARVRYSLDSNVNTPFVIIHTIIGVRHQTPSTKSRPCTPALNP